MAMMQQQVLEEQQLSPLVGTQDPKHASKHAFCLACGRRHNGKSVKGWFQASNSHNDENGEVEVLASDNPFTQHVARPVLDALAALRSTTSELQQGLKLDETLSFKVCGSLASTRPLSAL